MSIEDHNSGKILKFEKNAEYHFRKYKKHIDQGDYIKSLAALRNAIDQDANNTEYSLALAELLTEMELFSESNSVLFDILIDFKNANDFESEILFYIGCNFVGLQDYDKAVECFERYLYKFPNSEFAGDASNMLEYLKSDSFIPDVFDLSEEAYQLSSKGRFMLDSANYSEACIIFEQLTKDFPNETFLKNNLSLAYYCAGRINDSIRVTNEILDEDPHNIHAICNMVLYYKANNNVELYNKYLSILETVSPESEDESLKIFVTFCETDQHEKAYNLVKTILSIKPYNTKYMFLCAAACANMHKYDESYNILSDILKISPDDSIASYYLDAVKYAINTNESLHISYIYQVPTEEVTKRLKYLNKCLTLAYSDISEIWSKPDGYFRKIIIWGISLKDQNIKNICLNILFIIHDPKAIKILKSFLLDETEPDAIKNEIFLVFNSLGIPQPYLAYISGKIAEVRVGAIENKNGLNKSHEKLVSIILSSPYAESNRNIITDSIRSLTDYFSTYNKAPIVRNYNAWATALIYYSILKSNPELAPSLDTMCRDMDTKKQSVKRCLKLIYNKLKGNNNE